MASDLIRARAFAHFHHRGQRYGEQPYTVHLQAVSDVLDEFGLRRLAALRTGRREVVRLHMAAWLHDVIEDTPVTFETVAHTFGRDVAALVHSVTDESGATREERKLRTYPKIRAHGASSVALKLADRIANVRSSSCAAPRLYARYQREHEGFVSALRVAGEWDVMWAHLDGLIRAPHRPAALGIAA